MSFDQIQQIKNPNISNSKQYLDEKSTTLLKPKSAEGISGWITDVPIREDITLSADITPLVVENGSFITDHIVRKPARITLSGLIGENVVKREVGGQPVQEITNRLGESEAYLGDYTPGMLQNTEKASTQSQESLSSINQRISRSQNVVEPFSGEDDAPSRQYKLYQEIKALFNTNAVVTVQTPWDYYETMMIETITAQQGEETEEITDVSVTLKEIRFAETNFVAFDETLFPPRVDIQAEEEQDGGTVQGTRNSFAFDAVSALGGN